MPQSCLSRPIVAEPETASQVYLQSLLGQRTPLEARPPRHGVAVDQTADLCTPEPPDPALAFVGLVGFVVQKNNLIFVHSNES
jgi:hypothetical protein